MVGVHSPWAIVVSRIIGILLPAIVFMAFASCGLAQATDKSAPVRASKGALSLPFVKGSLTGAPGNLGMVQFEIEFNGRPTVGDLDNDGNPPILSSPAATASRLYRLSGKKLWDIPAATQMGL